MGILGKLPGLPMVERSFSREFPRGGLYRISIHGGKSVPLVEAGEFSLFPSVSRQGNRLVYSELIGDTDIWRIDLANSKGKAPSVTRLIGSSQNEVTPDFSPDGKKIAF